ncbi:IS66 family transposase [Natranaerovirga hydrolytica]|uniref:IS66 family transposase n=1 Tax=Natranaerovirga hydrolytica TaxID=680378 RepID=UPI0010521EFE|nr:IS66 family transposase [Natranaerovirga hydrolytica]
MLNLKLSLKYNYALPLYRQENYFKMMNVELSRQTLSNWVVKASVAFEPFYKRLKEELLKSSYIQADETVVKVIKEDGKDAKSQKYMWLYKTGASKKPIILYDYQKTRSSSCPKNFLKGFRGYLQTDGYEGYNKVENVKWISCLAHIRRKFYDIVITLDAEAKKQSRAVIGLNYCTKLYNIEKEIKETYEGQEDYYEKRYEIRLEKAEPIINEFIKFIEKDLPNAIPEDSLTSILPWSKYLPADLKVRALEKN